MEKFLNAVKSADILAAKAMLRDGAVDGLLDSNDLLTYCARCDQTELVEQLVMLGADVNKVDASGMSALHYCGQGNAFRALFVLLFSDAKTDLADASGRTPLMLAAAQGHPEAFDLLLEGTKDLEAVDKDGNSVLKIAVGKGLAKFVQSLVAKKASVNVPDAQGMTPLFFAAGQGNEEMVSVLLKGGADVHAVDHKRRTSLMVAAALGQLKTVQQLIRAKADLNAVDEDGNNVLHFVSGKHQEEFIQIIKGSGGAYMDNTRILVKGSESGVGAESDRSDYLEVTKLCLQRGVDVNAQNVDLESSLQVAADNGLKSDVELLLQVGANPNLKTAKGRTPFDPGHRFEELEGLIWKVRSLFPGGPGGPAPPERVVVRQSPDAAAARGDQEGDHVTVVRQTQETSLRKPDPDQERDSDGLTLYLSACANGDMKTIMNQLQGGVDVNQKDFQGRTGLMLAALQGKRVTVTYLLKMGASLEIKDAKGTTAIVYAMLNGQVDTVKTFVEAGCDVNGRSKGIPFLLLAISKGNKDLVQYLLEQGALIHEKDYHGAGALEYALASKSKEMLVFISAKRSEEISNETK